MEQKSKGNVLAAILLIVAAVYEFFLKFMYILAELIEGYIYDDEFIGMCFRSFGFSFIHPYGILFIAAAVLFVIACFKKKKGVLTIIGAALLGVNFIYSVIYWDSFGIFSVIAYGLSFLDDVSYFLGFVFLILGIIYYSSANRSKNTAINVLLYIGAFLAALDCINPIACIISWINYGNDGFWIVYYFFCLVGYVVFALAYFFFARWMMSGASDAPRVTTVPAYSQPVMQQPVYQQPVYQLPVYQQPVYRAPVQPVYRPQTPVQPQKPTAANELQNTEAILKYKELLDSGIITQEEFDAKKKEILGL